MTKIFGTISEFMLKSSDQNSRLGYIYVMTAAILWAISGSSAKFLFHQGVSAFQLVQLRVTLSSGILLLSFLFLCPGLLKISRRDIFYFLILGTAGMAGTHFFYLFAISKIKVAAAILLQYLAPTLVALYAVFFAHEKLSQITLMAVIGATIGCYLVVGGYNLDILAMNRIGIISGILSAFAFACYSLMGEYGMRRYSPWSVLFFALAVAALIWNIAYPPLEAFRRSYTPVEWFWILYIAVLGTILPFGLYLKGIHLIRSAHASITAMLEPIAAGIISYIFLNETMDFFQIIGGILVIVSVILLQVKQAHGARK